MACKFRSSCFQSPVSSRVPGVRFVPYSHFYWCLIGPNSVKFYEFVLHPHLNRGVVFES